MKTALITHYWKTSDGGGIKTYLVNLVGALRNKGADVSVSSEGAIQGASASRGIGEVVVCPS
jgi:hypothetical protein